MRTSNTPYSLFASLLLLTLWAIAATPRCVAGDSGERTLLDSNSQASGGESYFGDWFNRVDRTQAEQPHWMTPLATVTPRLEEEFRYDQFWETLPHGSGTLENFDGGKGLELIPAEHVEVIIGLPPYQERGDNERAYGFGDWQFALIKYRILSADEQHGNYILSAFFAATAPTGSQAFTSHYFGLTPTLAAGKGWGDFDIQTTFGATFPVADIQKAGVPLAYNITLQYHLLDVLWPELEANYTYYAHGDDAWKTRLFLTPGIVFGRFHIWERLKFAVGVGYQFAVTEDHPQYRNNWILSVRTPF